VNTLLQNLRYAGRQLRKSPGFTTTAVLTLALGIGANSAIFSVINATLLRPLPYADPARLVTVEHHYPSLNDLHAPISVPGFLDYESKKQIFQHAAVETGWAPTLTGQGDPQRVIASRVTGDYFATFGVGAELGRTLSPEENESGHEKVTVVSNSFWKRVLGSERAALGQRIVLDGESYEIVGVMPAGFRDFWNRQAELWTPIVFTPAQKDPDGFTNEFLNFSGRLAPGATFEQAKADIAAHAVSLRTDFPNRFPPDWGLVMTTLDEKAAGPIRTALYVLLAAVGFVLLIGCANVANLQLARAASRTREIAVRVALGASPTKLIGQLLTESVLLAVIGGGLGLLLAVWVVPAPLALNPGNLPPTEEIRVNGTVLLYTLVLSVFTGILFGIMPALQLARTDLHETLKEGGRGNSGDRRGLEIRRGLVVATVALALTLLAGAGLLVKSFARLVGVDPGFKPDHLLTFNISLPRLRYNNDTLQIAALERITSALEAVPGATKVGATSTLPFSGQWSTGSFNVEGYQPPKGTPGPWGDQRVVTPNFLPALGAPLLKGRQFGLEDRADVPRVVIVDQELVNRYWPKEDPIGKRITFNQLTDSTIDWLTVVGVVGHTSHEGLDAQRRVQMYFPLEQVAVNSMSFIIRTPGDPNSLLPTVKAAVRAIDPDLPFSQVSTMEALVEQSTGPRRFSMLLLGLFSLLAVGLASIGLYGVMSYNVTQRSRELGVRLALGAATRDLLGLVLRQGMRLVMIGVGVGLIAALAATRLLRSMLFNVSSTDPVTFIVIALVLLGVSLLAIWIPARRATKVDPIIALRAE